MFQGNCATEVIEIWYKITKIIKYNEIDCTVHVHNHVSVSKQHNCNLHGIISLHLSLLR